MYQWKVRLRGLLNLWRWRQYIPLKHRRTLTQRHILDDANTASHSRRRYHIVIFQNTLTRRHIPDDANTATQRHIPEDANTASHSRQRYHIVTFRNTLTRRHIPDDANTASDRSYFKGLMFKYCQDCQYFVLYNNPVGSKRLAKWSDWTIVHVKIAYLL